MIGELPLRWRRAREELRWRGPLRFSLAVFRELFSPLLYWYVLHVFEKDVEQPQADATREFDVKVYTGQSDLERLCREIPPMGEIPAEEVEARLSNGDAVAIAYAGNEPVSYAWMTVASGLEVAFGTAWILYPKEAAFYGSFTHPRWRGRGIQRCLDAALTRYAHEQGFARLLFSVSALNKQALTAFKQMSKRKIMTLILVRVRGLNSVYRKAIGAPLESRFTVSPQERASR